MMSLTPCKIASGTLGPARWLPARDVESSSIQGFPPMSHSVISTRRHPALFIAAMVVLVCVAFTFFLGAPLFVALMTHQWKFTQSQIGFIVTADTIGNAAGALAVALGIRGWPVRGPVSG